MGSCFTPFFHCICVTLSLFSPRGRRAAKLTIQRLFLPASRDKKTKLCKARREARRIFQPRRIAIGHGEHRLAEHGECGGTRYSVWKTKLHDLADFDLGVSGYFAHLQGLILLSMLMTLVNIPSMYIYDSEKYRQPEAEYPFFLHGSAVCTATKEVQVENPDGTILTETRNLCPYLSIQGYLGLGSTIFAAVFVLIFRWRMHYTVNKLDTGKQTAQDYSVIVHDPDADANDPNEWYEYFSMFGEVASITIALKNGPLLCALAERRFIKLMVQYESPEGTHLQEKIDNWKKVNTSREMLGLKIENPQWMRRELNLVNAGKVLNASGFGPSAEMWMHQYEVNASELDKQYQRHFPVAKVICVFETEQAQRKCLRKLRIGLLPSYFDWKRQTPKYRFRETNELLVREAPEPRDLIWENLGKSSWTERVLQQLTSLGYLCGINIGFAFVIWAIKYASGSVMLTTLAIALISEYAPTLVQQMVDAVEVSAAD
jgi:hypothetical protein